ncbi:hypothetical protein Tco_1407924 [Tanacetum coccineum]
MNQEEIRQVMDRDEKWVPTKERVKIGTTNVRLETTVLQKEETFQFWYTVKKVTGTNSYEFYLTNKKCLVDAKVFRKILDICPRVQGEDITKVLDDESTHTFVIDLRYKGPLYKDPNMFVDYMHQSWRTLDAIINKCLFSKSTSKGSQGKKNVDTPEATVDEFKESDPEPTRKGTASRRVIKKKVSIFVDDNIIPEPDITLKLGKSISLTEAAEEEAARQVYATHERIVIVSDPKPPRRRPSVIAFRDTSSVSKKMSPDPSQKLKASRKSIRSQPHARGSSERTGTKLGVPDESTVTLTILCEGTSTKPRVPEGTNDDDDDKSIDLEKTDYEETNDKFMHSEEYVQDNDEETNDELVHSDEQVNDEADVEKAEEVKDDIKKVELPPSDSSLSVSSDAKINSLLDVQIQQEIPHIQSLSVLTVPVYVIFEPLVLTPIPKTPSVAL